MAVHMTYSRAAGRRGIVYALLLVSAFATIVPFYWEFVLASHMTGDIASTPPPVWIGSALLQNYRTLIEYAPHFWRSMLNSGVIAVGSTGVTIFFSALGGHALPRYRCPFKHQSFTILLLPRLTPSPLGLIHWHIH